MNKSLQILVIVFLFCSQQLAYGQNKTITGTITDDQNLPLPGVSIVIEGTTQGTISDVDGNYSFSIPEGKINLVFSFIGFQDKIVDASNLTLLNVQMEIETEGLDEVVVVGYGTTKKKLVTGANLNMKGEDLESLNTASVLGAMKGISSGINIVQNSAQPGSGTKVFIRGVGTTGNSQPLYIVDGLIQGNIDYLSASDIQSIDVLKDAASAAIYGSRGANGVILVTTKKGRKNTKATVTYDGYQGWQNVYKRPDLLTAQEYVLIKDEARINDGLAPFNYTAVTPNWDKIESGEWKGTDWFDEASISNAKISNHSLNISGGGEKSVYSLGFSYFSQDGVMGKQSDSYYNRFTVRLNTEHVLFDNGSRDLITVGQNLTYTKSKRNSIRQGGIYWNDVHNFVKMNPLMSVYDENGDYSYALDMDPMAANPIGQMEYLTKYGENDNNNIAGNVYLTIEPIKGLSIQSKIGANVWWSGSRSWIPKYNLSSSTSQDADKVSQSLSSGYSYTWDNTATYDFKLEGGHSFTAMAGNSIEYTPLAYNLSATGKETLFQTWKNAYVDNAPNLVSASGNDDYGDKTMSYFGRLSYNLNETYMFSAMFRTDGSTNFGNNHKWGKFPSVSAGWVLSNESFLDDTAGWLDFFKIRASWGQVGNKSIPAFLYSSTIGYYNSEAEFYDGSYGFGDNKGAPGSITSTRSTGSYPTRIPNSEIGWETSEQLNIGFDANLFNSRMRCAFDWYDKKTTDWLVPTAVPSSNGISNQTINGGGVQNKGIELSLSWNDNVGDFKYGATLSYSYNKNEVTKIANTERIIHGQANVLKQGMSEMYRAQEGFPIGYFWGYQSDGVIQNEAEANAWVAPAGADNAGEKYFANQQPGDSRFIDQNGDGKINDDDKINLGQPMPDHIIGIQLTAEYKGAFLNVTGNGALGHQIAKSYGSGQWDNHTTDIFNRWHGEGTSNRMPRITSSLHERNDLFMSDLYVQDADYFKISNITLGYDMKKLIPDFNVLSEAKVYVTLQNYFTFTNYDGMDPEVGYGPDGWASGIDLGLYPAAKTVMVGLNLKF